jgi:hypothetical protein
MTNKNVKIVRSLPQKSFVLFVLNLESREWRAVSSKKQQNFPLCFGAFVAK